MEEKILIQKIKNSKKAGISHSEIRNRLNKKGYKLEYVDALIKKASAPRKFILISSIVLVILLLSATTVYFALFHKQKQILANPLEGLNVLFGEKQQTQSNETNQSKTDIHIEDIEITPEFLSYLLNEIGAWKLHKSPTTLENPIINFEIDSNNFNSEIKKEIKTYEGSSEKADMKFKTSKEPIIKAMLSEKPGEVFKESIQNGETTIEKIASDTELFSKGYLKLYDELK